MATTDGSARRARRVTWIHQGAEYVLGLVLIAAATQTPSPLYLALAGGLVIVNAAVSDGPLGAYRLVGRRLHMVLDGVVVVLLVVGALMPGPDALTRMALLGIAVVMGVLAWQTRGTPPPPPSPSPSPTSGEAATPPATAAGAKAVSWGRAAGRVAGKSARAVRDRTSQ